MSTVFASDKIDRARRVLRKYLRRSERSANTLRYEHQRIEARRRAKAYRLVLLYLEG